MTNSLQVMDYFINSNALDAFNLTDTWQCNQITIKIDENLPRHRHSTNYNIRLLIALFPI